MDGGDEGDWSASAPGVRSEAVGVGRRVGDGEGGERRPGGRFVFPAAARKGARARGGGAVVDVLRVAGRLCLESSPVRRRRRRREAVHYRRDDAALVVVGR